MRKILDICTVKNNEKGMTMLEVMIVLVIISIIAASSVTFIMGRLKSARMKQAKITMAEVGKALDMFYTDCGYYPSSEQGLNALVEAPSGEPNCSGWGPDPYVKKVPRDPWNHEYLYESEGGTYVLKSLGLDNREGGSGEDKDISSEDL